METDLSVPRSQLLLLRARMAAPEPTARIGELVAPTLRADTSVTRVQRTNRTTMLARLDALDPSRRPILIELFRGGEIVGEWRLTAFSLGLSLDPEGVVAFRHLARSLAHALGRTAARWTKASQPLVERLTSVAEEVADRTARKGAGRARELPANIGHALRTALTLHAPERQVLWFEISEPTGFLSLLDWEALLRPYIGVPLVRLPHLTADVPFPTASMDVLLACSTPAASPNRAADAAAQVADRILRGVPAPRRCVVHVFADAASRDAVITAVEALRLPRLNGGTATAYTEPQRGTGVPERGVIVYQPGVAGLMSSVGSTPSAAPGSTGSAADLFRDHPWAQWIRTALGHRAVDVCHVVASAAFSESGPTAVVAADGEGTTYRYAKEESLGHKSRDRAGQSAERLRFIGAREMTDFASSMGAWAVVLTALRNADAQVFRTMADQMSRASASQLVTHNVRADRSGTALQRTYRMLSTPHALFGASPSDSPAALVNHPAISIYMHPARVFGENFEPAQYRPHASVAHTEVASAFREAKQAVRKVMEQPGATPAWLAVAQRRLEPNVSMSMEARTLNDLDQAAQDGADEALKIALNALTQSAINWPPPGNERDGLLLTPDEGML